MPLSQLIIIMCVFIFHFLVRIQGTIWHTVYYDPFNFLITEKQTTKFSSANFKKNVKSKLYHIENSKTGGQTV